MTFGTVCPACSQEIPQSRLIGRSVVCSCGYTDDRARQEAERKSEKSAIVTFMIACIAIVVGFGHLVNWGGHAWNIPVLKLSRMLGTISPQGLESIIQACYDQGKWECVQDTHVELYKKTGNATVLARLADFRTRLGRADDAAVTYDWYVRAGGQDSIALYRYATLLEKAGKTRESMEMYARSIASSGDRLPVRSMAGLLRLLMAEQRHQEALDHLTAFHESSGNAKEYFVSERQIIEENLKLKKRIARR